MPFGLCNAPATFMRLMDKAFGDQNFQTLLIYLDDILVFGKTFQETLERLDMVLSRLAGLNLKVKPEKCQLFRRKLRYLGHTVSEDGISPDPEKTRAVQEWLVPKSERTSWFSWISWLLSTVCSIICTNCCPLHSLLGDTKTKGKERNSRI